MAKSNSTSSKLHFSFPNSNASPFPKINPSPSSPSPPPKSSLPFNISSSSPPISPAIPFNISSSSPPISPAIQFTTTSSSPPISPAIQFNTTSSSPPISPAIQFNTTSSSPPISPALPFNTTYSSSPTIKNDSCPSVSSSSYGINFTFTFKNAFEKAFEKVAIMTLDLFLEKVIGLVLEPIWSVTTSALSSTLERIKRRFFPPSESLPLHQTPLQTCHIRREAESLPVFKLRCTICGDMQDNRKQMLDHYNSHPEFIYYCQWCSNSFLDKDALRAHKGKGKKLKRA